ncbi:MAG: MerR family transcriptional regulator [Spirochaetes bacterium]|nr:MerR family transcriptional regulator [Spirochaetota bacterium]
MYTVKQVADLAGVSIRTLHYYDSIDLLKPSRISANGYRWYGEEALLHLQQILLYRELDFDLASIKRLMDQKDFSVVQALLAHKRALKKRIARLERLVETVDNTIARQRGDRSMTDEDLFRNLTPEERAYTEEAMNTWDPELVRESHRRYNQLSAAERQQLKQEGQQLNRDWAALIGTDPAAQAARTMVERWRKSIELFWTPDTEGLLGLARMYNEDERFKKTYDQVHPRLAGYILDCVQAYLQ